VLGVHDNSNRFLDVDTLHPEFLISRFYIELVLLPERRKPI
jgi:hypothetical protein